MIENTNYQGRLAFFRKHLNGDYSLGRSYWVNTFLVLLFAPALGLILAPLLQDLPARYSSAAVLALTVLGLFTWIWAISGTWASANKHVQRGGRGGWASAAKLMIVLGIIRTVGDVGNMSESLDDHFRVALGDQPGPQYTIQVSADGKSVVFMGGINDGAAEALTNALDMAPAVNNVVFSSMGGWVREGNLVANIISQRKISTYVEGECTSACTIAFLAGKKREVGPNAHVGFHQFKSVGEASGDSSDQAMARAVYERADVSSEFINKIVATPFEQVWYPDHNELLAANVITGDRTIGETTPLATRVRSRDAKNEDIARGLTHGFKQAAETINQGTPTMVDDETRLDRATAGPGAILTYHYTFPNYASDAVDSAWINSQLRESVTSSVCKSEGMKPALEYGGKYIYSYSGNDQKVVGSFQITRKDCDYMSPAATAQNFVPVRLPQGVQIELPKNWEAWSKNQRITLDSSVQSRMELTGTIFDASSNFNFAANYYDDLGKTAAIMNVRYYPNLDVSQTEARTLGPSDVNELDTAIRKSIMESSQIFGFSVLTWNGTVKQVINGVTAFVTEYKRSPQNNNGNFKVRLVRVFNEEKSFTMTISYRENQEYLLRPICDRIISSLRN